MSLLTALHSTFVGFTAASASGVRATLPLAIMAFAKHLGLVDLAPGTLFRQPTTTEPAHTAVAGSHRLHRVCVCEEVCLTLPMPHCALRIRVARVQHGEFCDSARARRRAGCRQGTRRGLGSSPLRHASPRGSRLLCHCSTSGCLWRCYGGGGARAPSHWRCDGECLVFSSCTNTERLTPESAPHRRPRASLSRTAWACCWRSSYTPQST